MANINLSGSIGTTGIAILGSASVTNTDAPYTLSVSEYTNNYINVIGSLTAQRAIIAPLTVGVTYIVKNSTTGGFSIEFKGITGNGVVIQPGSVISVVSDGTDYITVGGGAIPPPPVEIEFVGYGIIQDGYAEVEQYISNARFKATYNNITPTLLELTDDDGTLLKNVTSTPNSFSSDGYFQKLAFGEEVNFTLTVDGYYTNTFTIIWGQRNFFGIGPAGSSSPNFILGLSSFISNNAEAVFTVHPSSTDKIYYAHRTAYGLASIFVDGFEGGFTVVSTTIPITNPYGFTENYTLYESDNVGLGITSVEVI